MSRVFEDGVVVDLVYDARRRATALAVRRQDGQISIETEMTAPTGERLRPYASSNSLITSECILLPSNVAPDEPKAALVADVRAFIERHVELTPLFLQIATHYVLLSWVYDAFSDLPYLRFRGDYGTGKTRALLTLGHLCYKSFFASGASTVSPIFHILDAFQGTLLLDEADLRFSDATADLTKVLNNGTMRGLPVLRTMITKDRELSPRAFRVYGPKIVGMRGAFGDPALESRFLTEETGGRALPARIPVHLPVSFKAEALALRNRLLGFRLRSLSALAATDHAAPTGLEARTAQSALALLSLIDEPAVRAEVAGLLTSRDAALRTERSQTLEAELVAAVLAAFDGSARPAAAIGEVATALARQGRTPPMPVKSVGHLLRTRLRLQTHKSRGVYVVPATERIRVEALARRYSIVSLDAAPP